MLSSVVNLIVNLLVQRTSDTLVNSNSGSDRQVADRRHVVKCSIVNEKQEREHHRQK